MNIAENTFKMGYIPSVLNWGSGQPSGGIASAPLGRDDAPIGNILGAAVPTQRAVRRITGANVDSSSIAYATAANLTISVARLGQIAFEYWLIYTTSAVGDGIGVQVAFTGTANGIRYAVDAYTAPSVRADLVTASAFGTGLAPYASGPAATPVAINIKGSCTVQALGDLQLQLRAGGVSASLLVGSWGTAFAIS